MATKPNVAELVSQMPEVDKPGTPSKFTGPNREEAAKMFAAIFAGGRESLLELTALVKTAGDTGYADYKAGYVLHGLVLYAGAPGRENERALLAGVLVGALTDSKASPETKQFFIQEIQYCGATESVPALTRMLGDESLAEPATRALLSIRDGVAPVMQRALVEAKGRQRVGVVLALGRLSDPASVPMLRDSMRDPDAAVRLAAAWSLASMGDAASADGIFKLADGLAGAERSQATDSCLLLAETLASSGKVNEARQLLARLRDSRQEEAERHIRDAAERALKSLHSSGTA